MTWGASLADSSGGGLNGRENFGCTDSKRPPPPPPPPKHSTIGARFIFLCYRVQPATGVFEAGWREKEELPCTGKHKSWYTFGSASLASLWVTACVVRVVFLSLSLSLLFFWM